MFLQLENELFTQFQLGKKWNIPVGHILVLKHSILQAAVKCF